MLGKILYRIELYLRDKRRRGYCKKFGGIQSCCWCKQCAQDENTKWNFREYQENKIFDVLTCGVCGGTSLWMWSMIMVFIRPLDPPKINKGISIKSSIDIQ